MVQTNRCGQPEYMPEAAVSLRMALWIAKLPGASQIKVALDRMHLRTSAYTERSGRSVEEKVICDVDELLLGWESDPYLKPWCKWTRQEHSIEVLSGTTPPNAAYTVCDVEAPFSAGRLRIESKQVKTKVQEQSYLQWAIGQIVTVRNVDEARDLLAVAVPYSPRLTEITERTMSAPVFRLTGIAVALVHNHGPVDWFIPATERWQAFKAMAVDVNQSFTSEDHS